MAWYQPATWNGASWSARKEIEFVTAQTGSSVAAITWNNTPEQAGDFVILACAANSGVVATATAPVVLVHNTASAQTGRCLAYQPALLTGSDTCTLSAAFTRIRGAVFRGAREIVDWSMNDSTTAGSQTNVPGVALDLAGYPDTMVYDFIYSETAGNAISGQDGTNIGSQTSGASWRDSYTRPGAVAQYTPTTATIANAGGHWIRWSVAIR